MERRRRRASAFRDLTTLVVNQLDTITYVDPSGTGYASDFPTSNLAIRQSSLNNGLGFLESNASYLDLLGIAADILGTGTPIVAHQSPPLRTTVFPITYMDNFTNTSTLDVRLDASSFGIAFVDSARYKNIQMRDVTADAYGTLDLPAGNYANVLRLKEINTQTDSTWIHTFLGWQLYSDSMYTDSTFSWSDNTKGYLLAQAQYVGGVLDNVKFQDFVLVGRVDPLHPGYLVYPNPATDRVSVKTDGQVAAIRITDLQGRLVFQQALNGVLTELNVNNLPTGCYLYSLCDEFGAAKHSGKLLLSK